MAEKVNEPGSMEAGSLYPDLNNLGKHMYTHTTFYRRNEVHINTHTHTPTHPHTHTHTEDDDDILTALTEPPKPKKPPRPPPPRSQLIPSRAIDAVLNDDRLDIPGVETTPTDEGGGVEYGRGHETGPTTSVS